VRARNPVRSSSPTASAGFTVELLVNIVQAGFATAQSERVCAGGQPIEVTRAHITDAGRRALKDRRTE